MEQTLKPPPMEFNTVAKPKGNWQIPKNVAEVRAGLADGKCVEFLDMDNEWMILNPYTAVSDANLNVRLANGRLRFNLDKKVVYSRAVRYQLGGVAQHFTYITRGTKAALDGWENEGLFVEWIGPRTYSVIGKDVNFV